MRRRPMRSERMRRRAGPAPQARRDDARQRHGAGERRRSRPKPRWRFRAFYVEVAVIGFIMIVSLFASLESPVRWIMSKLGY